MTVDELRESLEPMVGHMILIGGGSTVKLFEVVQAEVDEPWDQTWLAGEWIARVGDPSAEWTQDEDGNPVLNRNSWSTTPLKQWIQYSTNITLVE